MKKRTYINPVTHVLNMQPAQLIAESVDKDKGSEKVEGSRTNSNSIFNEKIW